ncbi:hypothetical protein B0H10DRAFT_2219130 [Mycena sp. CBHHK59/15]|nr:hypothetical protein B0H10DRAFT_2219130 [Mycena sp. CBHHK59/15]
MLPSCFLMPPLFPNPASSGPRPWERHDHVPQQLVVIVDSAVSSTAKVLPNSTGIPMSIWHHLCLAWMSEDCPSPLPLTPASFKLDGMVAVQHSRCFYDWQWPVLIAIVVLYTFQYPSSRVGWSSHFSRSLLQILQVPRVTSTLKTTRAECNTLIVPSDALHFHCRIIADICNQAHGHDRCLPSALLGNAGLSLFACGRTIAFTMPFFLPATSYPSKTGSRHSQTLSTTLPAQRAVIPLCFSSGFKCLIEEPLVHIAFVSGTHRWQHDGDPHHPISFDIEYSMFPATMCTAWATCCNGFQLLNRHASRLDICSLCAFAAPASLQ